MMAADGFSDDPFGRWLAAMVAADKLLAERRAERKAARRLELRPVRAEAARKGWATRRAREAAEAAAQAAEDARDDELAARRGNGPWCDAMAHDAVGREVFCILAPGHNEALCEDEYGYTWNNED